MTIQHGVKKYQNNADTVISVALSLPSPLVLLKWTINLNKESVQFLIVFRGKEVSSS